MKINYFILFLVAGFAFLSFKQTPGIAGKWYGFIKGPHGEIAKGPNGEVAKFVYDFNVNGNQFTGIAQGPDGSLTIKDGKINNSTISFYMLSSLKEGYIGNTGKFYGDSILLNVTFNADTTYHFVLRRTPQ
jgi:hypothetical protein